MAGNRQYQSIREAAQTIANEHQAITGDTFSQLDLEKKIGDAEANQLTPDEFATQFHQSLFAKQAETRGQKQLF